MIAPFPNKQYSIIYADPPWNYSNGGNGNAKKHYSTMSIKDICVLPVHDIAAPDCARDRIVQLFGDLPRIELFARQKHPGWDAWGNEVGKEECIEQY